MTSDAGTYYSSSTATRPERSAFTLEAKVVNEPGTGAQRSALRVAVGVYAAMRWQISRACRRPIRKPA